MYKATATVFVVTFFEKNILNPENSRFIDQLIVDEPEEDCIWELFKKSGYERTPLIAYDFMLSEQERKFATRESYKAFLTKEIDKLHKVTCLLKGQHTLSPVRQAQISPALVIENFI